MFPKTPQQLITVGEIDAFVHAFLKGDASIIPQLLKEVGCDIDGYMDYLQSIGVIHALALLQALQETCPDQRLPDKVFEKLLEDAGASFTAAVTAMALANKIYNHLVESKLPTTGQGGAS